MKGHVLCLDGSIGKILMVDYLRKLNILIVDWCCMCKRSGESIEHLLLHCPVAMDIWIFVFVLFGIFRVMPRTVFEVLECWQG